MLLRYVPAPYTILEGMQKLKPGHYLKYKQGALCNKYHIFRGIPASEVPPSGANYKVVEYRGNVGKVVRDETNV